MTAGGRTGSLLLESTITCPGCGHARKERMAVDACQYYYECAACGTLLRPLPGDCCVFCSFGSVKCPPVQMEACCSSSQKKDEPPGKNPPLP